MCKKCGLEKEFRFFSPRKDSKDRLAYWCAECKYTASRKAPGYINSMRAYYANNREKCIASSMRSVEKKRKEYSAKTLAWQRKNKDRVLLLRRVRYALHPEIKQYYAQKESVKRARKKQVLGLGLAYQAEIDGFYLFCRLFRGFQVDHIVPLNGKTVSGLHTPWNLQVLTRSENARKSNKLLEI